MPMNDNASSESASSGDSAVSGGNSFGPPAGTPVIGPGANQNEALDKKNIDNSKFISEQAFGRNDGLCLLRVCVSIAERRKGKNFKKEDFERLVKEFNIPKDFEVPDRKRVINWVLDQLDPKNTEEVKIDLGKKGEVTILKAKVLTKKGWEDHYVEGDDKGRFLWDPSGKPNREFRDLTVDMGFNFVNK